MFITQVPVVYKCICNSLSDHTLLECIIFPIIYTDAYYIQMHLIASASQLQTCVLYIQKKSIT